MHLSYQVIAGKIVIKNHPTWVTRLVVELLEKCVEGMQMNWASYLVNEIEKECREPQDQGYEFHFSWLLVLITFVRLADAGRSDISRSLTIGAIGHDVLHLVVYK
jgi:hypothetical protein